MCLYTNNEQWEGEIQKIIPFTIASQSKKCLGIHLTKELKHTYSENYKTLKKGTEQDMSK